MDVVMSSRGKIRNSERSGEDRARGGVMEDIQ